MNFRMEDKSFRFSISEEDMNRLLDGQEIEQRACVGRHCFAYSIVPVRAMTKMKMEMAVSGFCLYVPRKMLEDLRDSGPSKDGLTVSQGDLELSLRVDAKEQARKAA